MWAGLCKWSDLCDGTLSMNDLIKMHRSLNLKQYLEQASADKIKDDNGGSGN